MIEIKSVIDYNGWLEVTWAEGDEQVFCGSYSGHPEHIQMLRDKAVTLGTSLDEYEDLITKVQSEFKMPSVEELNAYEQEQKVMECTAYLAATDWVEPYLIRHELGLELLAADSEKFVIKQKRDEAKAFLKTVGV